MYRGYDSEFGLAPRIYRTPEEIRLDICEAKRAIEKINLGLNIRSLMMEMLSADENLAPEAAIPALENIISEAEEALFELSRLHEDLSLLEEELYEVKCEIGT